MLPTVITAGQTFSPASNDPTQKRLRLFYSVGLTMFILGQLITFADGRSQVVWFAITALVLLPGLRIKQDAYRLATLLLVLFCIAACAYVHLQAFADYLQHVREQHSGF